MKKIYPFGPWITDSEIEAVKDALSKKGLYDEPYKYVEKFQREFADYHGRKFGIMTPNCTSAIHLLLLGLGVGKGDEVIVPEATWIASVAPVVYVGATPVFCDIEEKNWCLDPKSVEKNITKKTKAIIAVDLHGNMPNMTELQKIAKKHKIYLIEDSAQALGSVYKGKKAGSFGIGSVFSFHRSKTIATGEGGMLLLDNKKLFDRCYMLRDHGRKPKGKMYYNYEVTPKYIPTNIQAALGWSQLQRIEKLIGKKRWILEQYRKGLRDVKDIELNPEPEGGRNGVWVTGLVIGKSYTINKEKFLEKLKALGVPPRPFFYPLSSLPAFGSQSKKYSKINPVAYDICNRGINLPCDYGLDKEQTDFICRSVKKVLGFK